MEAAIAGRRRRCQAFTSAACPRAMTPARLYAAAAFQSTIIIVRQKSSRTPSCCRRRSRAAVGIPRVGDPNRLS